MAIVRVGRVLWNYAVVGLPAFVRFAFVWVYLYYPSSGLVHDGLRI